ncbi:MAG: hypothetical protein ABSC95_14610 [Acetobacteraceae bacterium]
MQVVGGARNRRYQAAQDAKTEPALRTVHDAHSMSDTALISPCRLQAADDAAVRRRKSPQPPARNCAKRATPPASLLRLGRDRRTISWPSHNTATWICYLGVCRYSGRICDLGRSRGGEIFAPETPRSHGVMAVTGGD